MNIDNKDYHSTSNDKISKKLKERFLKLKNHDMDS